MTEKERILIIACLKASAQVFSRRSCNDPPDSWFADWTRAEIVEFDREMHVWNNTPDEHDSDYPTAHFCDWLVLKVMASKLESETTGNAPAIDCIKSSRSPLSGGVLKGTND